MFWVNFVILSYMKTVIKNISKIVQCDENNVKFRSGKDMSYLKVVNNGFIEIDDGIISNYGDMDEWKGIDDWNNTKIVDAEEGIVFPSYCDSHTHLVYAESREKEFFDRINGLSYQEIAKKGGGILNSAKKISEIDDDELYERSLARLNKIILKGTGAIEIKSGYGLSLESELKILRVIKKLKENSPIFIKSTFLGAHAVPLNFKNKKSEYVDHLINDMLPLIKSENLADYIDVFCEDGYFDVDDTIKILKAGKEFGLKGKTHVNQFNSIGGVKASIDNDCISVDHLEVMKEEDFSSLKKSNTIATLLPSCSFFIDIPYAPAKDLIKHNIPFALATDYNPGSSPNGNMNLVVSMACIKMKISPEAAINAATINGAAAMELADLTGSITIGKFANLNITSTINSYGFMPYSFGQNHIEKTMIKGKWIN